MPTTTTTTPTLRLRYFNIEGPAEKSRLALRLGKIPFEDARVSFDDWRRGDLKATTPYGQLPVLEITDDGRTTRTMAQSDAILRYCGRLATRAGVGVYDDARAEARSGREDRATARARPESASGLQIKWRRRSSSIVAQSFKRQRNGSLEVVVRLVGVAGICVCRA